MNWESSRIIDSNGTKYRVGWDEHGWFTIQHVELIPMEAADEGEVVSYEGEGYYIDTVGEYPNQSFTPSGAEALIEAIEER